MRPTTDIRKRFRSLRFIAPVAMSAALLATFSSLNAEPIEHAPNEARVIRIGVMDCAEPLSHTTIIQNFLDVVAARVGKHRIAVERLDIEGLEKAVREKRIDLFLGSAGFYRALQHEGVRDLATVTTRYAPDADAGDGAVFFVPKGSNIETLEDLKGKTVAGKNESAFAGWLAATGELAFRGIDPEHFFGKTIFVGMDMKAVVEAVRLGRADAGVLPVCFFEEIALSNPALAAQFRLLNEQTVPNFACRTSTRLYPNWTVAITPSMPAAEARLISSALLETDMDSEGLQWNIATRFEKVDAMLEALKIGPYVHLREWTLRRIANEFWPLLLLSGSALFGTLFYAFTANRLIKRRTKQLSDAIKRESQYKRTLEEADQQMQMMRRMNAVNKLSSILAHELRQPLNAVVCYAHGLRRLLDKPDALAHRAKVDETLERMSEQAKFAESVVKKVRSYAKNETKKEMLPLAPVIEKAVRRWLVVGNAHEHVATTLDPTITAEIDAFEIELLVVNLLRNTSTALRSTANARIRVKLEKSAENPQEALLVVADNGPKLKPEAVRAVTEPFTGYEGESMGYGLLIVREITANHGGTVSFEMPASGGLTVTVRLPVATDCASPS